MWRLSRGTRERQSESKTSQIAEARVTPKTPTGTGFSLLLWPRQLLTDIPCFGESGLAISDDLSNSVNSWSILQGEI